MRPSRMGMDANLPLSPEHIWECSCGVCCTAGSLKGSQLTLPKIQAHISHIAQSSLFLPLQKSV